MKRYIFLVAAVALATVSCSKTYDTNRNANQGTAISIGSWASGLTRAARGAGAASFVNGDTLYVFGAKKIASPASSVEVFDGVSVGTADNGTTWTYSPIRFWDRGYDYYDFYAITPSEETALDDLLASYDVAAGTMTSKTIALAGNDKDILIADSVHVLKANYGEPVNLVFRHINAMFDLKVRKGAAIGDNGKLAITKIAIENIDSLGTFQVTGYADTAIVAWNATGRGAYTNLSGIIPISTLPDDVATDATSTLIDSLIVMPQDFRDAANIQQLKISYTITTGTGANEQVSTFTDKVYPLHLFDKTDYDAADGTDPDVQNADPRVSGWAAGVHYTSIITIDAEAIEFTAEIDSWGVDNGYYYIIN